MLLDLVWLARNEVVHLSKIPDPTRLIARVSKISKVHMHAWAVLGGI